MYVLSRQATSVSRVFKQNAKHSLNGNSTTESTTTIKIALNPPI
jgi:hypothetical protein